MGNKVFTDEGLLIGFLQERWHNRGHCYLDQPCLESQLPNHSMPTITLHRDMLTKFRDDYAMVVAFAAHVCRVPIQEFAPVHMLQYLQLNSRSESPPSLTPPPAPAPAPSPTPTPSSSWIWRVLTRHRSHPNYDVNQGWPPIPLPLPPPPPLPPTPSTDPGRR